MVSFEDRIQELLSILGYNQVNPFKDQTIVDQLLLL
jgi:hypothetical protein